VKDDVQVTVDVVTQRTRYENTGVISQRRRQQRRLSPSSLLARRGAARQLSSVSAVVRTAKTNERLNRTGQFYYAIIARCVRTAPPRRRCDLGVTVACQRPVDLCSTDTVTASPAAAAAAAAVPRAS